MELVFIRIKESKWCDLAEPVADTFAKAKNLKLTKYIDAEIPKKYDELLAYPVLFFVNNEEIVGYVKGYSNEEKTMKGYENELSKIKNPDLAIIQPVEEIKE
jgi:hypothetical protein